MFQTTMQLMPLWRDWGLLGQSLAIPGNDTIKLFGFISHLWSGKPFRVLLFIFIYRNLHSHAHDEQEGHDNNAYHLI
jgi:hypothetical protein